MSSSSSSSSSSEVIKKSLELQRKVLGDYSVYDDNESDKLVAKSASQEETVVYNKKVMTPQQMLELQRKIIQ